MNEFGDDKYDAGVQPPHARHRESALDPAAVIPHAEAVRLYMRISLIACCCSEVSTRSKSSVMA